MTQDETRPTQRQNTHRRIVGEPGRVENRENPAWVVFDINDFDPVVLQPRTERTNLLFRRLHRREDAPFKGKITFLIFWIDLWFNPTRYFFISSIVELQSYYIDLGGYLTCGIPPKRRIAGPGPPCVRSNTWRGFNRLWNLDTIEWERLKHKNFKITFASA